MTAPVGHRDKQFCRKIVGHAREYSAIDAPWQWGMEMALHVHLHDPDEEETPGPAAKPASTPRAEHTDQQQPTQLQAGGASPFHQISAQNHNNLAEYHEAACKQQGLGPEELEAHQRAGHAHALAAQAHEREMPEALKFGEIAQKHSATAEDMTRDRQKMFLRR